MSLKEKYADKIAKLLAKAESTTPEEAELLYAKAQELMTQYAIDEAMVEAARGVSQNKGQITEEEFVSIGIYLFPLDYLTQVVLRVNGLKMYGLSGKNPPRTIDGKLYRTTEITVAVGFKSDIDRARVLVSSLMLQAITAENRWWKEHKELYQHEKRGGHYHRRQFLFSFAAGVLEKLQEAAERGRKAAEAEHTSNSVALVLRDKGEAVEKYFAEMYPDLRKSRNNYQGGGYEARAAGHAAGRRADVGQPTVGGGNKALGK